jgi:UDP-glucose 4-epimerase
MRVLVTGSAGFLGAVVLDMLRARGYEAIGYDLAHGHDVLDPTALARALAGCSACIHLAAVADLYVAEARPEIAQAVNVEGTRCVAQACRAIGARMLYASTCCVYGNNGVTLCDETATPAPTEIYAQTKLAAEAFVSGAGPRSSVLRLATFYGPGMRESLATSLFLRRARAGRPLEIHGSGRQTRCYTHVGDVASAVAVVLGSSRELPCVNVATPEATSVLELAELAIQVTGVRVPLLHVPDRPGQIHHSRIDSRLLQSLGWVPRWSMRDGLAACVEA